MKKQNVVATLGTLALVANLLLPGMAFGQDTGNQDASQLIDCPGTRIFNFTSVPTDVSFDDQVASPTATETYDAAVLPETGVDQVLPAATNTLAVNDTRSGGVTGCPTTEPGFQVTANISSTLTSGLNTIPDDKFQIITSNEFDTNPNSCTTPSGKEACYSAVSGTGNLHDVDSPELYDDEARAPGTVFNAFRTKAAYTELVEAGATETDPSSSDNLRTTNTLDQNVVLMSTSTSHNQIISTGVLISGTIPGNQAPGTYSGVITYSLIGYPVS